MKKFKIDAGLRNQFFFQIIYGLFYPATLGTILVYTMQDIFEGKLFNNEVFSLISLSFLIWYFLLDFHVGFLYFKGDEQNYDMRHMLCDVFEIIALFLSYYALLKFHYEFLFFICVSITALILILLDYFNSTDDKEKFRMFSFYPLLLSILGLVSLGMLVVSVTILDSLFYKISKYLFILFTGIVLVYYTIYVSSDEP